MKIRKLFEGPTVFEWVVIACMVAGTMQVMANLAKAKAKAKSQAQAQSQINK